MSSSDDEWRLISPLAAPSHREGKSVSGVPKPPEPVASVTVSFLDLDLTTAQVATDSNADAPARPQLLRAALRELRARLQ